MSVRPLTVTSRKRRKKTTREATSELFELDGNVKRKSNTWNILGKLNFLLVIKAALENFDIIFAWNKYISYSNKINLRIWSANYISSTFQINLQITKAATGGAQYKKVFINICKIHRNTPAPESLFNKVVEMRPATLSIKRLWHSFFPVNFAKF